MLFVASLTHFNEFQLNHTYTVKVMPRGRQILYCGLTSAFDIVLFHVMFQVWGVWEKPKDVQV